MKKNLWMLTAILTTCGSLFFTSCSDDDTTTVPDVIEQQLQQMTLREKIGQMFMTRIESLDTTIRS